ncbi:hypothetical protein ABG79_02006 [Caloramator mitchellensis]|uniref:DUF4153 domain-containing protein n=1 Tax=Caloramator mitchellensis TaxID=908809 RepID=A0A0R3JZW8_CALMK|nr:hypothetical protein [Caloramator mitchellensis]KRQ86165.1 hypothetical protein ABG79_02006 [Caloramator mitchellensis]
MGTSNFILKNIDNPHELERMYRNDPEQFRKEFQDAWSQKNDSEILSVWYERLYFKDDIRIENKLTVKNNFWVMGILAILSGINIRLIMHFVEKEAIAPANLAFGLIPFIALYFLYNTSPKRRIVYSILSLFIISIIYLNLLPLENKDSIILSQLHLPLFLWILLGLSFAGNEYKSISKRLAYLKFNGEFCILYASMAISGMILAALTIQLFNILGMDISEIYFENVVLFGAAALSVVASYLILNDIKLTKNIAPYIAKIFAPLLLATLIVYLIAVVLTGKNPFLDRNFLLSFNGVLVVVLAVTIFSITENRTDEKRNISDYINFCLIILALLIDTVALSAIIFRLSYGITPNRVAVLGANLLIYINLIWILSSYFRYLKNKTDSSPIEYAIAKYLPIYGLWAAFVTFAFPLIFR